MSAGADGRDARYVIIVKEVGLSTNTPRTDVISAGSLRVAINFMDAHVGRYANQSAPSFREGDLRAVAIMRAEEYRGDIDMSAEDLGYDYGDDI